MGNRRKNVTINNADNVNINTEIDYDKLGQAIASALLQIEEKNKKEEEKKTKFRRTFIGVVNKLNYVFIAMFCAVIITVVWINVQNDFLPAAIALTVVFIFIAIMAIFSLLESFNDNYNREIALFNSNIALIGLIIAIIALYKSIT